MNILSNWITPNNDGINDHIILHYTLPETNYVMNVYLFDRFGRNHGRIIQDYTLQNKGAVIILVNQPLQAGIYIL